jgi:hypothetical protein
VPVRPERREQLLLEDLLDGLTDPGPDAVVHVLAELKNGGEGCATVLHGVSSIAVDRGDICWLKSAGGYAFFNFYQARDGSPLSVASGGFFDFAMTPEGHDDV